MDNVIFVSKGILLDKENKKILVLKRSNYKPESGGLWDILGGSVEYGEDCRESIVREAKEEVKANISNHKPLITYSRKIEKGFVIMIIFVCDTFEFENDKPNLSNEHTEYKWIDYEELLNKEVMNSLDYVREEIVKELKLI